MSIGRNIRRLRERYGMSQAELAAIAGVSDKAVSTWENDLKIPRMGAIARMAAHFGIAKSAIIEDEPPAFPYPQMQPVTLRRIPILGGAACGAPVYQPGDGTEYATIAGDEAVDFALVAEGDSMTGDRIHDGDVVFFVACSDVDDGQIAAVAVDEGVTIKHIKRLRAPNGRVVYTQLLASNPAYDSIDIGGEDETRTVKILGKAVAFKAQLNR